MSNPKNHKLAKNQSFVLRAALMEAIAKNSVLVVGGEASADMHAARVMHALREQHPNIHFFGIGGEQMRNEGMEVIAPAEDLATAGLTEVLFALPRIFGIMKRMEQKARDYKPSAALLLDLPDFNLRLAKRLKRLGIPVIYYISPQLWAWRPKRVETVRQLVDHMLVILPFEEKFYQEHQVPVEFVGHPLCEILPENPDKQEDRSALDIGAQAEPVIALLPGSRRKEVLRHLPRMLEAMQLLSQNKPNIEILIPVASTIPQSLIEELVTRSHVNARIVDGNATKVINAADLVVACSGTATLQTALLLKPMVVVYRVSWLSYQILRRLISIANIGLVNLVAGKTLATELIQNAFSAGNLKKECQKLLEDAEHRQYIVDEFSRLRAKLAKPNTAKRVGEIIQQYLPSKP